LVTCLLKVARVCGIGIVHSLPRHPAPVTTLNVHRACWDAVFDA
jgi:hypothetical protein